MKTFYHLLWCFFNLVKLIKYRTLVLLLATVAAAPSNAQFQRAYGNSLDNSFSKVIKDGSNYYVIGQDESINGATMQATVTRVDAAGVHLWTLRLEAASIWNDAVLTPSGDLLVVGNTLPFDNRSKSIVGRISTTLGGSFTWLKSYDAQGQDGFYRIVKNSVPENVLFPYYILGSQNQVGASMTTDDVVLLSLNDAGTFQWKKIYVSNGDDEFYRDLEVMTNGDLILSGNNGSGLIFRTSNAGNIVSGIGLVQYIINDVTPESSGGIYAVANNSTLVGSHLMRLDQNLFPLYDVTISQLNTISQVWTGQTGKVYVVGTGSFGGQTRTVLIKLSDLSSSGNVLLAVDWVKYFNVGANSIGGGYWKMSNGDIGYTDARNTPTGFGQLCAFLTISDPTLDNCLVSNDKVSLKVVNPIPNSPVPPPIRTVDILTPSNLQYQAVNWQGQKVCNSTPCVTSFTNNPIDNCGNFQYTSQSTGTAPITYSWNFGDPGSGTNNTSTASNPTHQFSKCGDFLVCLKITSLECIDSICKTASFNDLVKPIITCPPNLTFECNFNTSPSSTGFATATDNCTSQNLILITSTDVLSGTIPCKGIITRTWKSQDKCNNISTCQQLITINDNVAPIITCPQNIILGCNSNTNPTVTGIAIATDNCTVTNQILITSTEMESGTMPCNGTISRKWKAQDDCNNISTCTQSITIKDDIAPTIICPPNDTVNTNIGVCYFTGNIPLPSAKDNCDPVLEFKCSLLTSSNSILITSLTQYPKGINTISCFATDDCSNQSKNCNFTLTVVDNESPQINCPPSITVIGIINTLGECHAIGNNIASIASDNCPMLNVSYSITGNTLGGNNNTGIQDASGTDFTGSSIVTYLAKDMAGNANSCSFMVDVICDCECDGNLIKNPGFNEGNISGNLGGPGQSDFWQAASLTPQVAGNRPGACDSTFIQMWGQNNNGESICQPFIFIPGRTYAIKFMARFGVASGAATSVGFRVGATNGCIDPNPLSTNSIAIGATPLITSPTWSTYTIPNWIAPANANNFTNLNISAFSPNAILTPFGHIDNICIVDVTPCDCKGSYWENISFNLPNGSSTKIECNTKPLYILDCNKDYSFNADYHCKDSICSSKVTYALSGNLPGNPQSGTIPFTYTPQQSSTNVLTIYGWCGDKICDSCKISFTSTCECTCDTTSFDFLFAISKQVLKPVHCGDTLEVPPSSSGLAVNLFSNFHCNGNDCDSTTPVEWTLSGPNISPYQNVEYTTTTGSFANPINASLFSSPGLYTLTMEGHCGDYTCKCTIYFNQPDHCCQSYDLFCDKLMKEVHVSVDSVHCKATINIGALSDCDSIVKINWGDSQGSAVHIGSGGMAMHTYIVSGTYVISWLALEYNYATSPPTICFEKVFKDTIMVKCCDTCSCGKFDFLYAVSKGPLLSKHCGDTLVVPSTQLGLPITFISSFSCMGTNCTNDSVEWTLTGPSSFVTMSGKVLPGPILSLPNISASTFSNSGLYTLTLVGHCGNNSCPPCKIYFYQSNVCCQSYDMFCNKLMNAVSITVDSVHCKTTLNIGALTDCDSIVKINWGDGQGSAVQIGSGGMAMHAYAVSGTYIISWLALEYNYATTPPTICFEKVFKDTIMVKCCDTCSCGKFDFLYAVSKGPLLSKHCGDTLVVPSIQSGLPITFISSFSCMGTNCTNDSVEWTLTGPSSFVAMSGKLLPGLLFSLPFISASTFSISGLYTLTLIGHCGNNSCPPCKIYFYQPDNCCKSYDLFCDKIMNAVNITVDNALCKTTLKVGDLSSCDSIVQINWGDNSTISTHIGAGGMAMHSYTFSGTYIISYTAFEYNPNAIPPKICFDKVFRDTITVNCCDTCKNNLIKNPGFSIGAIGGNLDNPGASTNWHVASGTPQVGLIQGCCDPAIIQMWGDQAHGEAICQTFNFIPGHTYSIRFHGLFYSNVAGLITPYVRFGFTAANGCIDPFTCTNTNCVPIGSSVNITDTACMEYSISNWTVPNTPGLNTLIIRAFNNTPNNNDGTSISFGRLDNVCVRDVTLNNNISKLKKSRQESDIKIRPNPTFNSAVISLSSKLVNPKNRIKITAINGRVYQSVPITSEDTQIDMIDYPAGLYFISIHDSHGNMIDMPYKLIKQ